MKLFQNSQQKTLLIAEAKSFLFEIQSVTGKKNSEISKELGVSYRTLYGLEKEKQISRQLLKGLELYLDNLKLRRHIVKVEAAAKTFGITLPLFDLEGSQWNENPGAEPGTGAGSAVPKPKPPKGPVKYTGPKEPLKQELYEYLKAAQPHKKKSGGAKKQAGG